jgi:hypothetical protein
MRYWLWEVKTEHIINLYFGSNIPYKNSTIHLFHSLNVTLYYNIYSPNIDIYSLRGGGGAFLLFFLGHMGHLILESLLWVGWSPSVPRSWTEKSSLGLPFGASTWGAFQTMHKDSTGTFLDKATPPPPWPFPGTALNSYATEEWTSDHIQLCPP